MKNKKHKSIKNININTSKIIFDENNYYNNSVFNLKIDISNIEEAGLGVFSQEYIPKNSFIGFYEGNVINEPFHGEYYFEINEYNGIDANELPRCFMAMINDSRGSLFQNNCKFTIDYKNFLVEIWSTKNIYSGEELFINYGSGYWVW